MTLEQLGWCRPAFVDHPLGPENVLGRVAVEHRSQYVVYTERGERTCELAGRLRLEAERGAVPGLPAVGDWVELRPRTGEDRATIMRVLPRRTSFVRKQAGRAIAEQVVAANIDIVFLVTAFSGDWKPRRLERYLTLAWESGALPVAVLNKADLCPDHRAIVTSAMLAVPGVEILAVSAHSGLGLEELARYFSGHRTVALLGSSGVGKSSLINRLIGRELQQVQGVREDGRGRHTTTRRELILRPGGGLLIDTPGMRELQLWDGEEGVSNAFVEIEELAMRCRFSDCAHRCEPGCAVLAAVREGILPAERLASYEKLTAELRYLERKEDKKALEAKKRSDKHLTRALSRWLVDKRRS
jgi:ribosome biogenesis GTPase